MAPMYYRKANAAILVYDVTKRSSFNDMKSWIEELQRNSEGQIVICILGTILVKTVINALHTLLFSVLTQLSRNSGNKTDLEPLREVTTEVAIEYAEGIGALLFETSALANFGIQDAFAAISRVSGSTTIRETLTNKH